MKTLKRVLAIAGIVIILGLYITTLIVAVLGKEQTKDLFIACIVATVVIPCMFYIISWVSKVLKERNTGENQ